jgi:hypothetical protein
MPESDNPYQSPTAQTYGAYGVSDVAVADLVATPAVGLIVTGGLGMAIQALYLLAFLVQMPMLGRLPGPEAAISFLPQVVLSLFGLVLCGLVIVGAQKMKRLESYSFAMAAAIISVIPCFSPCCVIGLPFGVWAIVILNKPEVKAAFRS